MTKPNSSVGTRRGKREASTQFEGRQTRVSALHVIENATYCVDIVPDDKKYVLYCSGCLNYCKLVKKPAEGRAKFDAEPKKHKRYIWQAHLEKER